MLIRGLLSTIPENGNSIEDAQCPGLQYLIEVKYDANKVNLDMDCLPKEWVCIYLLMKWQMILTLTKEISDVLEGTELNSSDIALDDLMGSPEKQYAITN